MKNLRVVLKKIDPGVVMYLVIIDKMIERYRGVLQVKPTEKFTDMIQDLVIKHVIGNEDPPEQIRGAILNLADDMMAGREVSLRAGDYIALMDYARETGAIK